MLNEFLYLNLYRVFFLGLGFWKSLAIDLSIFMMYSRILVYLD